MVNKVIDIKVALAIISRMDNTLTQLWFAKRIAEYYLDQKTWKHSYRVMVLVSAGDSSIRRKILAILHDVIEDKGALKAVIEKIREATDQSIVDDLLLLTHRKEDRYRKYIQKLAESGRADAIAVKIADLTHNMDLSRLDKVEQYHLDRNKKYEKAHRILTEALEKLNVTA